MSHTSFVVKTAPGGMFSLSQPDLGDVEEAIEREFEDKQDRADDRPRYWDAEVSGRGQYPEFTVEITLYGGGLTREQFDTATRLVGSALSSNGLRAETIRITSV